MEPETQPITQLLNELQHGRAEASAELAPMIYRELRALAAGYMRRERAGHTLQPTALVHEAFLRLVDQRGATWESRSHFFGIAARLMRRILVDHARKRSANKRGGGAPVTLNEEIAGGKVRTYEVLAVDQLLERLERMSPRQCRIVELRFFTGLDVKETAEALGVSAATVKSDWLMAKAWLARELVRDAKQPSQG